MKDINFEKKNIHRDSNQDFTQQSESTRLSLTSKPSAESVALDPLTTQVYFSY